MLYNRSKTGIIKILRKAPDIAVSNSGIAGGVTVFDPTAVAGATPVLQLGPPALSIGSSTGWDVPFSMTFALGQLINSTDITQLCDKYRITGAYVRMYYNKSNAQAGATAGMPYVEFITDHDDNTPPTTNSLREKMGVKLKTFKAGSSYIGLKCVPKPAAEIENLGGATAFSVPTRSPWINSAFDEVPHYGIKGIIRNWYLGATTANVESMKFDVALTVVAKDFQ